MFEGLKRVIKLCRIKLGGKSIIISKNANFDRHAQFEGNNKIGENSWFDGFIGFGSYIGDSCTFSGKIGRYCSIGHKVAVLTGTHPSKKFVSTHPAFFSLGLQNGSTYVTEQKFKEKIYADETKEYGCIVGNDVWIGYDVTIMGGCTIGDGAIVASGALVNRDVSPYTIVAGQPAREIGKRFTDEHINWLLNYKWWEKPESWIKECVDDFEDIEKFIEKHKEG